MITSMRRAHSLQEVVDAGWAPSVRWLREAIKRGDVPGRRLPRRGRGGRASYAMTDEDIEQLIARRRVTPSAPTHGGINLTAAGARRRLWVRNEEHGLSGDAVGDIDNGNRDAQRPT